MSMPELWYSHGVTSTGNRRLRSAGSIALLLAGAFAFVRLTGDTTIATEAQDPFGYAERQSAPEPGSRDLRESGLNLTAERGGWTYAAYDRERDARSVDSYRGFGCLDNCDSHAAGYWWAHEQAIADPIDCSGDSWAFVEGCVAMAETKAHPSHREGRDPGLY